MRIGVARVLELLHKQGWREQEDGTWSDGKRTVYVQSDLGMDARFLLKVNELMNQGFRPRQIAQVLRVPYETVYRALERFGWRYDSRMGGWYHVQTPGARKKEPGALPTVNERIYHLAQAFGPVNLDELAAVFGTTNHSVRQLCYLMARAGYLVRPSVDGATLRGLFLPGPVDPYQAGVYRSPEHPIYEEDADFIKRWRLERARIAQLIAEQEKKLRYELANRSPSAPESD